MPTPFSDIEFDAIMLAHQQVCIESPGLKSAMHAEKVRRLLLLTHPRFAEGGAGMPNLLSRCGCLEWYPNTLLKGGGKKKIEGVEKWIRTGYGQVEYKAIYRAIMHSAVRQEDGTYRLGSTEDVTAAAVEALVALGHDADPKATFDIRCMFHWASCADIRRAGYVPGTRKGAVLQRAKQVVIRELFAPDDSVGARLDRHEAELETLRAAVLRMCKQAVNKPDGELSAI